jgi:hypothetical protein
MNRLFVFAITVLAVFGCHVVSVAALVPVLEYSFPNSYDGTSSTISDLSAAGNDGTMDATASLVDDRPTGFNASLMSLTGSNGGHGDTDAVDLLTNSAIGAAGGGLPWTFGSSGKERIPTYEN